MKKLLLFLTLLSSVMAWSQQGLVSGELNVTSIPSSQGGGTFELVGTFSDPKGLYFAADVDATVDTATVALWKGNNYYTIAAAVASGSTLTLTVTDTYNTGFLPTGIYSVGQETPNLRLPGVSTTGDSNPALATPPDAAAKMNYILLRIDGQVAAQLAAAGNGMFALENQDSTWKVSRYNIDQRIEGFLRDKGQFQLVDSAGGSGLLLDVTAGADNNLAGYVQLGNGVNTPLFLLEGEGETGNDRAIKLGMGDSLYRMPLVYPGAAGLPEGMYVMVWDSAGMNAGTLGWLDVSTFGSGGATSNYYYVSKSTGDNATAVAGDPTKPWSDPWAASSAAPQGSMIFVTDGRWTYSFDGTAAEIQADSAEISLLNGKSMDFYFNPSTALIHVSAGEIPADDFTVFDVSEGKVCNVYGALTIIGDDNGIVGTTSNNSTLNVTLDTIVTSPFAGGEDASWKWSGFNVKNDTSATLRLSIGTAISNFDVLASVTGTNDSVFFLVEIDRQEELKSDGSIHFRSADIRNSQLHTKVKSYYGVDPEWYVWSPYRVYFENCQVTALYDDILTVGSPYTWNAFFSIRNGDHVNSNFDIKAHGKGVNRLLNFEVGNGSGSDDNGASSNSTYSFDFDFVTDSLGYAGNPIIRYTHPDSSRVRFDLNLLNYDTVVPVFSNMSSDWVGHSLTVSGTVKTYSDYIFNITDITGGKVTLQDFYGQSDSLLVNSSNPVSIYLCGANVEATKVSNNVTLVDECGEPNGIFSPENDGVNLPPGGITALIPSGSSFTFQETSVGHNFSVNSSGTTVNGPFTAVGSFTAIGSATFNSGSTSNGPTEVNDAFTVNSTSTFNGSMDIFGTLSLYDDLSLFADFSTVGNVTLENLQGPPGVRNLGINGDGLVVVSVDTLTISIDAVPSTETLTPGETAGFWIVPDHLVGAELIEVQYAFRNASTGGGDVNVQLTDTFVGFAGATLPIGDRVSTQDLSGAPITLTSEQLIQPLVASMALGADPEGLVVNLKIVKP